MILLLTWAAYWAPSSAHCHACAGPGPDRVAVPVVRIRSDAREVLCTRVHVTAAGVCRGKMDRMAKLDVDWAINEIDLFLRATDQVAYDNSGSGVMIIGTHMRASETEASQRAHVIEQILDRV